MSAENFWDREVAAPTHTSWMEHPRVREYILQSISGSLEGLWPVDWFMRKIGARRFGRGLSIGTTGEGVETLHQLEVLRSEGCTDAQGFFFSRPQTASGVKFLLTSLDDSPAKAIA